MEALRIDAASAGGASPLAELRKDESPSVPFSQRIRAALVETDRALQQAEESARQVAEGKGDMVEAVLAISKADLQLRQLVTLRNRIFEAYQQVMRLQL